MKRILHLLVISVLLVACQKNEITEPGTDGPGSGQIAETPALKGHIWVKLKPGTEPQIMKTKSGGITTGISNLDLTGVNLGTYRMERVFAVGQYEERVRKEGLHLWYHVYFDEKVSTRSAMEGYASLPEVDKVAEIPDIQPLGAVRVPAYMLPVLQVQQLIAQAKASATAEEEEEFPFNDPRLPEQWHYHNTGSLAGSVAGADINVFEAWKTETGSPNVIVAVMDGGIQYNHPDLTDNMWVNTKEIPDNGIDEDGNGYIDDIYGYNFVTATSEDGVYSNGAITQYEHGTHCAGTISAVNNNKRGVCGIAGGSGKKDGVRLMSCQIFHMNGDKSEGSTNPDMYRYAADNGAVISQNSWTMGGVSEEGFLNSPLREAIDYFIKYAGCDVNGEQRPDAPMKGGVVIFAAANDNTNVKAFPAAYEKNLRVASMGPDFSKASYSNYGSWVDITAPGGEQSLGDTYAILSTSINSGYAWLQGTSMACPHASGCAALILSKFQGPGFTADNLRERIMATVQNIDQYNPKYVGQLGKGYIDVGAALKPATTVPPETTELKLIDAYDDWAIVEWTIMKADDGPINTYELSWSTAPINEESTAKIFKKSIDVRFMEAGEMVRDTITGLTTGTTYYYALRAYDRWGNISEYSPEVSRKVVTNQAPVASPAWSGRIVLDEGASRTIEVNFNEPENQSVTITMNPSYSWITTQTADDKILVRLSPDYGHAGTYNILMNVTDQYGASHTVSVPFDVMTKTTAPVVITPIADMKFTALGSKQTVDLTTIFRNPMQGTLIYEVENSNSAIAFAQRKENVLEVTSAQNGTSTIRVRAVNASGLSVSVSFVVRVASGGMTGDLTIFPEAVGKELNINVGTTLYGASQIRVYNSAGKQLIAKTVTLDENTYILDASSLSKGIYVLTIETNGKKVTRNFVKI